MNHGYSKPDVERPKAGETVNVKMPERYDPRVKAAAIVKELGALLDSLLMPAAVPNATPTIVDQWARDRNGGGDPKPASNEEAQYQRFKARLLADLKVDPTFLQLLAAVPEIVVEIEPKVITLDMTSGKGRLAKLAADGFFNQAREPKAIRAELTKTGPEPHPARMSDALTALVNDGFLVRDDGTYMLAAGVKVSTRELTKAG